MGPVRTARTWSALTRRVNSSQEEQLVVTPTLKEIPKGYSPEAVHAVMMIIAHESRRGEFIKQLKGPALGLINMEPTTHDSTWANGDSIYRNARLLTIIGPSDNFVHPPAERLNYDWRYNVFMARQRLFMKRGALPMDLKRLSQYLKRHWNSVLGAAGAMSYYDDYDKWRP